MKKLLLFGALFTGSIFTANAQLSCATAVNITTNGTQVAPTINGAAASNCFGDIETDAGAPLAGLWYTYTPTANGNLTISSNLPANTGGDTRLSIFTGTCAALTCYNGSDDVASNNFLTTLTIPVQSGTTYYIHWDNFWSSTEFDFTVNFAASTCLSPNSLSVNDPTNVTTNSATVSWAAAIGAPASYDVDWGAPGHAAGSGTIVNTTTTSANLTGLTTSANITYFIRANCGGLNQGTWTGPFTLYLAKTLPYSNNFDVNTNASAFADGTEFIGWGLNQTTGFAQSGNTFIISNASTTTASNAFAILRPVSLLANEQVTLTFFTRSVPATGAFNLNVTVGTAPTAAAQTIVVQSFTGIASGTYVQRTATWTAPTAGIYYFALHNNTGVVPADATLLVDTVAMTSVLSTNDFLASQLSVYPNPATNVINVSNADNILVNGVEIVDLNGRTVKTAKFDGVTEAQINISDLSAGMYMMTVSSDQGTLTKKIIKQ